MRVGRPCPPVRNDIVTPCHLLLFKNDFKRAAVQLSMSKEPFTAQGEFEVAIEINERDMETLTRCCMSPFEANEISLESSY